MRQWAVAWEADANTAAGLLRSGCHTLLSIKIKCGGCGEIVGRQDIEYGPQNDNDT